MTDPCPCGSGHAEGACCARFHAGESAPTAEALMRSRYCAFVRGEIAYLVKTHAPETRTPDLASELAAACRATRFLRLEIVGRRNGGPTDDVGEVEFVAHGMRDGHTFAQRERSRFRRHGGAWVYVDGDVGAEGGSIPKVGRNEPCPCGSGRKYKVCHARL